MKRYEEIQKDGEFVIRINGVGDEFKNRKKSLFERLKIAVLGEGKPLKLLWRPATTCLPQARKEFLRKAEPGVFNVLEYAKENGLKFGGYEIVNPASVSWSNLIPNKTAIKRAYAEFRVKEAAERDPGSNRLLTYRPPHIQFCNDWWSIAEGESEEWQLFEVGVAGIWLRMRFMHLVSGETVDLLFAGLGNFELDFCLTSGGGYDGFSRSYHVKSVRGELSIIITEYYDTRPEKYVFVPPGENGELYPGSNEVDFSIVGAHNLLFGGKWERVL